MKEDWHYRQSFGCKATGCGRYPSNADKAVQGCRIAPWASISCLERETRAHMLRISLIRVMLIVAIGMRMQAEDSGDGANVYTSVEQCCGSRKSKTDLKVHAYYKSAAGIFR